MKFQLTSKIAILLALCLKSTTLSNKSWPRVTSVVKAIMSLVYCVTWHQNWRLSQRSVENQACRFKKIFLALDWLDLRFYIKHDPYFIQMFYGNFLPLGYFILSSKIAVFSFFRDYVDIVSEYYFYRYFPMSTYCSERYTSFQFSNMNFKFWSDDHYFVKIFNYFWIAATFCLSFYFAIHVSGVAEFFDKIYSIPIFMVKS